MNAHATAHATATRNVVSRHRGKLLSSVVVAGLLLGSLCFPGKQGGLMANGRLTHEAAVELYERAVESVAWIKTPRGHGTGWVVDANKGILVTALHVVANGSSGTFSTVELFFPKRDQFGEVIHSTMHYRTHHQALVQLADVIHYDAPRDMAVLKLRTPLPGLRALPLAFGLPKVGQEVHVIGNSAVSHGGLFGYCNGHVRNVFHWAQSGINCHVVAHHVPTNHGDSGGPVLNNKGEVVAFISQGTTGGMSPADVCGLLKAHQPGQMAQHGPFDNVQVLDHSIAVNEIRTVLGACQNKGGI